MKTVELEYNIPQQMSLAHQEPYQVGPWLCYLLEDGRVLPLPPEGAESLEMLTLSPGESFGVCYRCKAGAPAYLDIWLTPETEQRRAAVEIQENDLAPLLLKSIEQANQRKKPQPITTEASKLKAPIPLKPPGRAERSTRIPLNVAAKEIVRFARQGVKESGENWGDAAMQDWCSTILITAQKLGFIGMWDREEEEGATAA